jgi:hypothetical protein
LHPPFGGFGMNMGIGDAVDLGWKIAAHLDGWGGDDLLASYEIERRPVHERTIAEAVHNFGQTGNQILRPDLEAPGVVGEATRREVADLIEATKVREFKTLGIVLGTRYVDSPIIVADGSMPPPDHFMLYVPSAYPGCLAPHLWPAEGSSLYDHFGPGFTLLVTDGDARPADRLSEAAAKRNMPLKVLAPANVRLRQRYEARFALIRPDQHVAWRGDDIPTDCDALLAQSKRRKPEGGRWRVTTSCSEALSPFHIWKLTRDLAFEPRWIPPVSSIARARTHHRPGRTCCLGLRKIRESASYIDLCSKAPMSFLWVRKPPQLLPKNREPDSVASKSSTRVESQQALKQAVWTLFQKRLLAPVMNANEHRR